eukprot:3481406-Alexandrium_andersonii.AAC.1
MTRSAKWVCKHDDPMANQQRWHCSVCGELHMMKYGVMCEFSRGVHQPVLWCRASIPDDPFKDVQLMAVE